MDVEVSNPLQIELTVSRLRLVATLEATAHHAPASAEAAPSAGACREYKGAEPTTSSALQVSLHLHITVVVCAHAWLRKISPVVLGFVLLSLHIAYCGVLHVPSALLQRAVQGLCRFVKRA